MARIAALEVATAVGSNIAEGINTGAAEERGYGDRTKHQCAERNAADFDSAGEAGRGGGEASGAAITATA